MFNWLKNITKGYKIKNLNFEEVPNASILDRRLTVTSAERQKS